MGRPCKSDEETKSKRITVRFTLDEYNVLAKKAKVAGLEESVYARDAILKGKVIQKNTVSPLILAQLGKVGNNLNQITKRINSNAHNPSLIEKDNVVLKDIKDAIHKLTEIILKY